ncbi:DUF1289 domain-containing protein [Carboxylicivirga taeanensis]|uniref:DUF1289 domain-containing protein n=1 Tax=Carboxylicivirga taeanensis TaxID=1416875 RepID=UPI003F6E3321
MKEIQSPCISVCQYDSKGICFGCRRTVDEAGKWSTLSNEEKENIIKELSLRKNVAGEEPTIFLR